MRKGRRLSARVCVRLDPELARGIDLTARILGTSKSEVVRAILEHWSSIAEPASSPDNA